MAYFSSKKVRFIIGKKTIKHLYIFVHERSSHEHCKTWVPIVWETLQCQMAPESIVDKYAVTVAVIKKGKVFGRLNNCKSGKFGKTIFFLRADTINSAEVKITGKL